MRILVVEDDRLLNNTLCYNLDTAGYAVDSALTKSAASNFLTKQDYDLIVLDVNLPDGNGFDFCREVKERRPDTAVIFLTANDMESDMLKGYELGAGEQYQADRDTYRQVDEDGYADHLHYFLVQFRTEILGTQNGRSEIDDFENEESEHDNLVDYPYGGNTVVRVAAQHDGVHRTEHHDEKCLYKDGGGQLGKPLFQAFLLYHCPCMCTIL